MPLFKILASFAIAVMLAAAPASAHVSLKSSSITPGAVIETLPETLTVTFTKPVGLTEFMLENTKQEVVPLSFTPPKGMKKSFSVPLPRLMPGSYTAKWKTIGKDGHAMTGKLQFELRAPKTP